MISGFKRISPVLSGQALVKRKAKNIFSKAIGKATLQRSLHYKVICRLVIVNEQWGLLLLFNYLTKTGKYDKTFLARPSGSRQLQGKIVQAYCI